MKWLFSVYGLVSLLAIILDPADAGKSYSVSLVNERVFSPCENSPDNFLSRGFDMSNITFEYKEDDTLFVNGDVVFLLEIPPTQIISASADVFKKQRGQWVSTVYSLRRSDLCETVFSPVEFWYRYTQIVPEDDRGCPPEKGMVYHISTQAETELKNLDDRNAEGEYKGHVTITYGAEPDEFICFNVLFTLTRT